MSDQLDKARQVPRSLQHAYDLHFASPLDEEDKIATMGCMAQAKMQVIALLEATWSHADLRDLRLNLGDERRCPGRVVERDEVTNIDEVCPCGGQDNQLCHGSGLVSVTRA